MKWIIILTTFFGLNLVLAQDQMASQLEEFLKERDRMFESIRKGMLSDEPFNDSFFEDMDLFGKEQLNTIKMNWVDTKKGRRLEIHPEKSKDALNIEIKDQKISLSGKIQEERTDANGKVVSKSSRSFSQIISIPDHLDSEQAKISQVGDKIVVDFPYRNLKDKKPALEPIEPEPGSMI